MSQSINRKILFDFFDGKATAIQRRYLEAWLREAENEAFFFRCLDEWEAEHPQYVPEADGALAKFLTLAEVPQLAHDSQNRGVPVVPLPRRSRKGWFLGIAASFMLLATGYFFEKPLRYQSYQTGNAQTRSFYLPDCTLVALNANSTLWVPRWGFADRREVLLEGEGEFNVTHTTDHRRFTVKTVRDFNVEVLGTEFVVFARPRGNRVVLNKGKVKVHFQQKLHTLQPGDMLTLPVDANLPQLTKITQPELQTSWKNHQFYFDDTPLSEVRLTLEEHFGFEVVITDSTLKGRRLSGYFKADTPREIVDILSTLLGADIQLNNNRLTISKQPINQ